MERPKTIFRFSFNLGFFQPKKLLHESTIVINEAICYNFFYIVM